jgi:hypothetical protein
MLKYGNLLVWDILFVCLIQSIWKWYVCPVYTKIHGGLVVL